MRAQGDAHGLDCFAACDLEERRFGLRCGVAGEELRHAPADGAGFECFAQLRERLQTAREGAALRRPPTPATAALERVRAQGGEPELVDALTEAVQGLADSEAEAAGAACEAVELGVELGDFRGRGSRAETTPEPSLGGGSKLHARLGRK